MKKAANYFIALTAVATLFIASCSTEDDPNAQATPASTDPRDKFNGLWAVSENSTDYGASTYNCTISDSSVSPYVLMAYLYSYHTKIKASISGNNITIPTQLIEGNNVQGNGTLTNSSHMSLTYYVQTTSSHYDTVTATLTK